MDETGTRPGGSKENLDTDDLIIVGNKDNHVKVESHEFQKDEK